MRKYKEMRRCFLCNAPANFRVTLKSNLINLYESRIHIMRTKNIKRPFFICYDCLNDEEVMPNYIFLKMLDQMESIINLKLYKHE